MQLRDNREIYLCFSVGEPMFVELHTKSGISVKYVKGSGGDLYKEFYLNDDVKRSQTEHANMKLIKILSIISLIIIVLAIFNYINLSISSNIERYREIGIKKTLGASNYKIFIQFISETFLICTLSIVLAICISYLFLPVFEKFTDTRVNIIVLFQTSNIIFVLIGIIL